VGLWFRTGGLSALEDHVKGSALDELREGVTAPRVDRLGLRNDRRSSLGRVRRPPCPRLECLDATCAAWRGVIGRELECVLPS